MTHANTQTGGVLDRSHTIAKPGFNRWLVPPAALAVHLCIGMAYGFSVFWLPLSQAIGISKPLACPADAGILNALFTTTCDWKVSELGWMYTLFFVLLGSSAAMFGGWLMRDGEIWAVKRPAIVIMQLPTDGPFRQSRSWYSQFFNPRSKAAGILAPITGVHHVQGWPPFTPEAEAAE